MIDLILAALACFALTHMVVNLSGPWNVFERLRTATYERKWINLECEWCLSTYIALPLAFLLTDGIWLIVYWFALVGASMLLATLYDGL